MLFHLNSLLLLSAFVVVCYRPKITNAMSFPSPQVTSKTDVSPISNQNHHNHQSISLASNYKVVIKSNKAGFETWELFSILGDTDNDRARCSKACLKRNHDDDDGSKCCSEKCFTLQCIKVEGDENDSCTVKVQVDQHIADDALCREENELLIEVLCRIILQRTLSNDPSILYGSLPDLNDILSREEVLSTSIFDKLSKKSEIVEMVNQDGVPLATVPRDLIHKLNLLHRGIGIVVSKDEHIRQGMVSYPDVYCHQRTSTKRIFPSLYDMFVGGVSEAGEESNVTAAREVAEELGLKRGLSGALSEPLFNCAVCTSYNRCIVTVFTYECNSVEENVTVCIIEPSL